MGLVLGKRARTGLQGPEREGTQARMPMADQPRDQEPLTVDGGSAGRKAPQPAAPTEGSVEGPRVPSTQASLGNLREIGAFGHRAGSG